MMALCCCTSYCSDMIHCGSIVADVSETWAVVMPYKFGSAEVIVNWECSTVPVAFVEK